MLYKVDFGLKAWRAYYPSIYERLLEMAILNNNTEADIILRMTRMQAGDTALTLLVEFDAVGNIESHCLIQTIGTHAFIEQCVAKPKKDSTFVAECEEYIQTTMKRDNPLLQKIVMYTDPSKQRAFERKYGFSTTRILMEKDIKPLSEDVN